MIEFYIWRTSPDRKPFWYYIGRMDGVLGPEVKSERELLMNMQNYQTFFFSLKRNLKDII